MKEDSVVSIERVSFSYKSEKVLDDVSLEVKRGEFLGLIGPNGSGKTTLLKIILGLLKPDRGTVELFGQSIEQFSEQARLGYVPQRVGLSVFNFPISVSEVVQLGLVNTKKVSKDTVREALNAVEMHKYKDRLIGELSGGQQQRVFIARALVSHPELLVLDEPTVGVDNETQASFYELLRRLNREKKLTLILVSHDIDVVTKEVTMVACLNGKMVCHLPAKDFKKSEFLEEVYGGNLRFVRHNHHTK